MTACETATEGGMLSIPGFSYAAPDFNLRRGKPPQSNWLAVFNRDTESNKSLQIGDCFNEAIKRELAHNGLLATGPGPGVAETHPALTGVYIGDEGMKAYEIVPVAAAILTAEAAADQHDAASRLHLLHLPEQTGRRRGLLHLPSRFGQPWQHYRVFSAHLVIGLAPGLGLLLRRVG